MLEGEIYEFSEDEEGYAHWLAEHPQGFVINVKRGSLADEVVLHRTTCHCIGGDAGNTRGARIGERSTRVCSLEVTSLSNWAERRGRVLAPFSHDCLQCKPLDVSSTVRQRLVNERILQQMALKRDLRFLHGQKQQILFWLGLLGGPFALSFVLTSQLTMKAPIWPIIVFAMLLNTVWALIIALGHRSIAWEEFKNLSYVRQQRRLYYESMWLRAYQAGYVIFASVVLLWGMVDMGRAAERKGWIEWDNWLEVLLVGSYVAIIAFLLWRRLWLMKVAVEGTRVHRWLGRVIVIVYGVAASAQFLLPAGRLLKVTRGKEYAVRIMGPLVLSGLWILTLAIGVAGVLWLLAACLQYRAWRVLSQIVEGAP
ncbi:MAG: hypothetical protein GY832_35710 [Chloroflexi bacterium]|nr:hypothetical protein [Chloroflexota bacterium]